MTRRSDVILTSFSRKYRNILQQLINKLSNITMKANIPPKLVNNIKTMHCLTN